MCIRVMVADRARLGMRLSVSLCNVSQGYPLPV